MNKTKTSEIIDGLLLFLVNIGIVILLLVYFYDKFISILLQHTRAAVWDTRDHIFFLTSPIRGRILEQTFLLVVGMIANIIGYTVYLSRKTIKSYYMAFIVTSIIFILPLFVYVFFSYIMTFGI